jgi:hypothetical protein
VPRKLSGFVIVDSLRSQVADLDVVEVPEEILEAHVELTVGIARQAQLLFLLL